MGNHLGYSPGGPSDYISQGIKTVCGIEGLGRVSIRTRSRKEFGQPPVEILIWGVYWKPS